MRGGREGGKEGGRKGGPPQESKEGEGVRFEEGPPQQSQ